MTEEEIRRIVDRAVDQTLTKFGIDPEKPLEFQKDMQFTRSWRTSTETVKRQSLMSAVAVLTLGVLGLIWTAISGGGSS